MRRNAAASENASSTCPDAGPTKLVLAVLLGYVLEWVFFSFLYEREHLQQILMTYGLILVFENCRLAAQARVQKPWAWWRDAQHCEVSSAAARAAASRAGLDDLLERPAGLLSQCQKRQLEIAMCLATQRQALLLDEPLAGMGAEETERMLRLLAELKSSHAILLVQHDMDAVFRIADCIAVMVNGAVIASGTPDFVRNSTEVRLAYLGDH
jgi:branched-chain amino acid transport system ATP-binding protein